MPVRIWPEAQIYIINMKKIIFILLFILCSCIKINNTDKTYILPKNYAIQYKKDTTYYFKIIDYIGLNPIIDSIYFAKEYKIKE